MASLDIKADMSDTSGLPDAQIAPSILNSDLSELALECERLMEAGADCLHLDVMDGHFVSDLTFGPPVIAALARNKRVRSADGKRAFFDVHLMVSDPSHWIVPMQKAGANRFTFHVETVDTGKDLDCLVTEIRQAGMLPGVAIKPGTPADDPRLSSCHGALVDLWLVMTVEPGCGGQKFMSDCLDKVRYLRKQWPLANIEVDGGVGEDNVYECGLAGANVIVSGTALLRQLDLTNAIADMRNKTLLGLAKH